MGTAYTTYFNGWRNLGGTMFNHYADIGQYSKWGYWGALENYLDTGSPKYNALTGFISSNPCWWIGCAASATSAIPPANTTPPSVPTNLAGSAVSATQINLSWTASTNTAGAVAGYNVFRNGTKVGTISTTSYQDTGLSSGTTYTYAISSYNAAGKTSAQSSSISVTTPAPTPGPPQVVITTPLNGSLHKSATDLNIAATASGASGIASITINANRMTLRTCTSTTSCSVSWQGSSIRSEGTHVVSVTAIDKLGQQTTASVTVLTVE
jgi:chitodextrinase